MASWRQGWTSPSTQTCRTCFPRWSYPPISASKAYCFILSLILLCKGTANIECAISQPLRGDRKWCAKTPCAKTFACFVARLSAWSFKFDLTIHQWIERWFHSAWILPYTLRTALESFQYLCNEFQCLIIKSIHGKVNTNVSRRQRNPILVYFAVIALAYLSGLVQKNKIEKTGKGYIAKIAQLIYYYCVTFLKSSLGFKIFR